MSKYSWVITKDFTDDPPSKPYIQGPSGTKKTISDIVEHGEQFRMLDDDGNVYYEGFIANKGGGFEPLDDYGMPNAGCTEIQYLQPNGEWSTL